MRGQFHFSWNPNHIADFHSREFLFEEGPRDLHMLTVPTERVLLRFIAGGHGQYYSGSGSWVDALPPTMAGILVTQARPRCWQAVMCRSGLKIFEALEMYEGDLRRQLLAAHTF